MDTRFDELSKSPAEGRRKGLHRIALAALVVLATLAASRAEAQTYTITQTLTQTRGVPTAINAPGQVVGYGGAFDQTDTRTYVSYGFLWTPTTPNGTIGSSTFLPPSGWLTSTAYEIDGRRVTQFPSHVDNLRKAKPVYETVPGWNQEISSVRSMDDLPPNARAYLKRLSDHVGRPVDVVSVGPDREQTIFAK